jgi:hypothetical protein
MSYSIHTTSEQAGSILQIQYKVTVHSREETISILTAGHQHVL